MVLAAALAFPAFAESPAVNDVTAPATAQTDDPFIWLEDVHGEKALAWVEKENARSLAVLKGDPRYAALHDAALKIISAHDRIPAPELIGETVYNFWQDADHVRGLWRRTTPETYASAQPQWEPVLDLDRLAADEKANWVWHGANCPPPHFRRCLITLSDGGEDAATIREFDLPTASFVSDGFKLPKSKQNVDWLDDDTLILARDWGEGTMTASGYPFVVKILKRGQSLDQATEVFRGRASDVLVGPTVLRDASGRTLPLVVRAVDFFHSEVYWLTDKGMLRLGLPAKVALHGLLDGRLIFTPEEDWTFEGQTYKAGSVLAFRPEALAPPPTNQMLPVGETHLLFEPGPRQSVEQVAVTAHRVVAAIYDNVRGSLTSFRLDGDYGGRRTEFAVTPNASVGVATAGELDDRLYFSVENFLTPAQLWQADAASGAQADVKASPARFDASGDTVDQYEATSSDGTRIPYFVVHPKAMKLDGSNPTLLYAYGGFQVSMLPSYSGTIGKLWLEHGGVYVLANIRGGGEFGPAWHDAGLKTHRQLVFDDFTAVAKDLIARGITSPRRLGIMGGSNGGLLMGVQITQHPELWRAVDVEVPLLDMLRFEKIGAGASWVGEYGSTQNPEERAFLARISPYANLKAGVAYPEPFFVTATSDDRVSPAHARKMAAKMQAMGLPFLYFENTSGGHAASANLQERAERVALEFTYLARKLMD